MYPDDKEKQQLSIDLFFKKYGKKGAIDGVSISIDDVLENKMKKKINISFIQN